MTGLKRLDPRQLTDIIYAGTDASLRVSPQGVRLLLETDKAKRDALERFYHKRIDAPREYTSRQDRTYNN